MKIGGFEFNVRLRKIEPPPPVLDDFKLRVVYAVIERLHAVAGLGEDYWFAWEVQQAIRCHFATGWGEDGEPLGWQGSLSDYKDFAKDAAEAERQREALGLVEDMTTLDPEVMSILRTSYPKRQGARGTTIGHRIIDLVGDHVKKVKV